MRRLIRNFARLLLVVALAGAFAYGAWLLLETAPQSKRERPQAPMPLVDVIEAEINDYPIVVRGHGEVRAAREIEVRPEVGGRIQQLHPEFEPGGFIPAGETLLELNAADYRLAVSAAEAEIAKARAEIAIEKGRRVVATEEFALLQGSIQNDRLSRELALREPQLAQVRAELAAAQNTLERAKLDLARTHLTLPYDVVVLAYARSTGEAIAARELVGRVARADEYRLDLRLSPGVLERIRIPGDTSPGSSARIRTPEGNEYQGEVVRIRPDLAAGSRLGAVVVAIADPLGRHSENLGRPALLIGSYVSADVEAGLMTGVFPGPRRALRDNGRLLVVDTEDRLRVRNAQLAWELEDRILLTADLEPGDRVIVSRATGLVPGMQLRSRLIDALNGQVLANPEHPR